MADVDRCSSRRNSSTHLHCDVHRAVARLLPYPEIHIAEAARQTQREFATVAPVLDSQSPVHSISRRNALIIAAVLESGLMLCEELAAV